jgi:hypothetical protein
MADFKLKYPSSTLVAITFALDGGGTGLASHSSLLNGRASTAVDNISSNLDLDHLVSGFFKVGSSGVAAGVLELWAYAQIAESGGSPVYPDSITGSDATKNMTSRNVLFSGLKLLDAIEIPATNSITYPVGPFSIADAFGKLPRRWGLFAVHNTSAALSSTAADHAFVYERIQQQSV